ncbi:MAG: hypothetical protein HUU60_05530 [Armatimonadetes bacterium]|nr:hypothetical protein [Armatimonadota bacterium]
MKNAVCMTLCWLCAGWTLAQVKTWTTTQDFNEGLYFNTNSTAVPGEIRLNRLGTAPVPFINIPVGGPELAARGWNPSPGRIVRVNTDTGVVAGEYRLTPEALSSAPSRAVVDSQGNVWVTNRYEASGTHSVTKIGVIVGGTRYYRPLPGVYIPHPLGEYVREPLYTTGVDRDGDGYIRTSAGLGNLLPWVGTAGNDLDSSVPPDAVGTVRQAADELITVFKRLSTGGNRTRAVAIDENDDIWVGNDPGGAFQVWKLDGDDGRRLQAITVGGSYVYSMFYQGGFLWVSQTAEGVRRVDVTTGAVVAVSGTNVGDLSTVTPYDDNKLITAGAQNHSPAEWMMVDAATASVISRTTTPGSTDIRGVTVDQSGNVWVTSRGLWSGGDFRVYKYTPGGLLINQFYTGDRPCGLGRDSNGLIWVTHVGNPGNLSNGNWATVIDPEANDGMGAIIGYVGLGTGSYNYSDGTGATTSQIAREGEWRVVYDSFRPNLKWGVITWLADVPAQTSLQVYARAANTRLGLNQATFYQYQQSGDDPEGAVAGRYVEIRVRLSRELGTPQDLTPALQSLTIRYAKGTVSGTVGLGNWLSLQFPNANFILRPVEGGSDIAINDIELGPFGAFAFTTPARGTYFLLAQSSHWLRQRLTVPIVITDDGSHGNVFALHNGDIDRDNAITDSDLAIILSTYGLVTDDLTGDGLVDDSDLAVVLFNFGLIGD